MCATCQVEWLGTKPLSADGDCPICTLDKLIDDGPRWANPASCTCRPEDRLREELDEAAFWAHRLAWAHEPGAGHSFEFEDCAIPACARRRAVIYGTAE